MFHVTNNSDSTGIVTKFIDLGVISFLAKSPRQATWAGDDFNNEPTWSFWCGHSKTFCVGPSLVVFSCIVRMGLYNQGNTVAT